MESPISVVRLTFADGEKASDIKFIGNKSIVAVRMPASWENGIVDDMSLYAGYSEADTPDPVVDYAGTPIVFSGAAGSYIALTLPLGGLLAVQLQTNTQQTGGSYIELICRDVT